jgi:hypothetical protein
LGLPFHAASEADRPALFALLAEAYSGASSIANLLGYLDLRSQIVERIRWASELCGDPLRLQRVRWQRTSSLMAVGAYDPGLRLMEQVRHDLGDDIVSMDGPTLLSVYGSAHLRSAVLAARAAKTNGRGYAQDAWARIDAARRVAAHMGKDRNDYGLAFGPWLSRPRPTRWVSALGAARCAGVVPGRPSPCVPGYGGQPFSEALTSLSARCEGSASWRR